MKGLPCDTDLSKTEMAVISDESDLDDTISAVWEKKNSTYYMSLN